MIWTKPQFSLILPINSYFHYLPSCRWHLWIPLAKPPLLTNLAGREASLDTLRLAVLCVPVPVISVCPIQRTGEGRTTPVPAPLCSRRELMPWPGCLLTAVVKKGQPMLGTNHGSAEHHHGARASFPLLSFPYPGRAHQVCGCFTWIWHCICVVV